MTTTAPSPLRRLYLGRFVFAIVWALLLVLATAVLGTAGSVGPLAAVLLVLYPVADLVAAVIDRRTSGSAPSVLLLVNAALSLLTAISLVIAVPNGAGQVLAVWGAWAITAGVVQLVVGVRRRALGGQWAMILSGGISVLAGGAFVAGAGAASPSVTGLAGYAVLGGVFFLISALRLRRASVGDVR